MNFLEEKNRALDYLRMQLFHPLKYRRVEDRNFISSSIIEVDAFLKILL
jgi:hypothetical protein